MSYEKPIELRVSTQNVSGTEARSVEALAKIERLLNKSLAAGDIFKSPSASIDYKTHEVTKSFFVRKDAEKIVRDTLKAHEELFLNPLTIASKEAKTRRYKVDVEGDRALASLRANTTSLGGRVYGNQHGIYIEVPSYKGSLTSAKSDAVNITQTMRVKKEEEEAKLFNKAEKEREKEAIKIQKEKEREEIRKQKEAEKEERQKEREKEKEERLASTESKHRGLAIVAGISGAILLLRKLISLVENIVTGVLKASSVAFTTTMEADRLNLDPVILRNMQYAGMAKGIGESPINALKTMQSLFGTQLLAAENVDKLKLLAPVLKDDIVGLINKGEVGKSPLGMTGLLIDSYVQNYKEGKNELGIKKGTKSANAAAMATDLEQAVGTDIATIFIRIVQDIEAGKDVKGFQQWIYDAMPISSPTSATLAAASENKKEYDEAVSELKSVINLIATLLSPLLNPLTEAIQRLSGFLMLLTGDKAGVAELSRKNYSKMLDARARDEAEIAKLTTIENEYLAKNKDLFPDEESFTNAVTNLQSGKVPTAIANDPKRLQEFFNAFGVRALVGSYGINLSSYEKDMADYSKNSEQYALGTKTFSFSDRSTAEVQSYAEYDINNAIRKAFEKSKGADTTNLGGKVVLDKESVTEYNAIEKELEELYNERSLYDPANLSLKALAKRFITPNIKEIAEVKILDDKIEARKARQKEINDAAKATIMTPVTSGTGFTMDDSIAASSAATTALNMLAGTMILKQLQADNVVPKDTNKLDIGKGEDGNLFIHFINEKNEKIGGTTVPISAGYGITENISLYLAQ